MDDMQKNNSSNISDDNYYNNDKHKDNRSSAKNDSSKSSVQKGRNRTDSFQKKKEESAKDQYKNEDPDFESGIKKGGRVKTAVVVTFAVVCLLIYTIVNNQVITNWFAWLLGILAPILIGAAIAYIVNPILHFFEYIVFKRMKIGKLRRAVSMFLTYVLVILIIFLLVIMILPELSRAFADLTSRLSHYIDNAIAIINNTLNGIFNTNKEYLNSDYINKILEDFIGSLGNISDFLNIYGRDIMSAIRSIYDVFYNILFGLIISFYILATKEKRIAQIKKFSRAMFKEKTYNAIMSVGNIANRCFGGFIKGKLFNALIIGILSYITFVIFGIPYPIIIAVFVGATDIIPVFGPFIGGILAGIIVFFVSPNSLLIFIILVVVIQQIDGNFIGPKILGSSTGISSLAVISAILIMGGLFGIVGMLIGVPLFALIIEVVKNIVNSKLKAKGYPHRTGYYYPENSIVRSSDDKEDILHKKMAINRAIDSVWARIKKKVKSRSDNKGNYNKDKDKDKKDKK